MGQGGVFEHPSGKTLFQRSWGDALDIKPSSPEDEVVRSAAKYVSELAVGIPESPDDREVGSEDILAPQTSLDTVEDVAMGAFEKLHSHLSTGHLSARQEARHEMRRQRRQWQIEDDIAATEGNLSPEVLKRPLVPYRNTRFGRWWFRLNLPA